jgi:hypothetical protein
LHAQPPWIVLSVRVEAGSDYQIPVIVELHMPIVSTQKIGQNSSW